MKPITPNQALAVWYAIGNEARQRQILAGASFVFVYDQGAEMVTVELAKDRPECGLDGCPKPGVQWGRCWEHAPP
jgi:hypothetical protein